MHENNREKYRNNITPNTIKPNMAAVYSIFECQRIDTDVTVGVVFICIKTVCVHVYDETFEILT